MPRTDIPNSDPLRNAPNDTYDYVQHTALLSTRLHEVNIVYEFIASYNKLLLAVRVVHLCVHPGFCESHLDRGVRVSIGDTALVIYRGLVAALSRKPFCEACKVHWTLNKPSSPRSTSSTRGTIFSDCRNIYQEEWKHHMGDSQRYEEFLSCPDC